MDDYIEPLEEPREPTVAEHAERAVLGAVLLSDDAAVDVGQVITGSDFADPRHEAIYDAAQYLAASGKPHGWLAVADYLSSRGDLARVGGTGFLAGLGAAVSAPSSAGYFAEIVREHSLKRAVRAAGIRLAQLGDADGEALDAVASARQHLDAVATRGRTDVSNAEALAEAISALDAEPGMPTPWPSLTAVTGGWVPGETTVVAARPAVGKTLVGIGAALDCARRGKTAVVISLEMSRTSLYHRMLSNVADVDGIRFRRRDLDAAAMRSVHAAAEDIAELPLVVHADLSVTATQVRSLVRQAQSRSEVGLVVIDYLALLQTERHLQGRSRAEQVGTMARELKLAAAELHVPIVMLAQINRAAAQTADGVAKLHHLRDSGEVEAHADVVVILNRVLSADDGDPSEITFDVAKNRHGPTSTVPMTFVGHKSRIVDYGPQWQQ